MGFIGDLFSKEMRGDRLPLCVADAVALFSMFMRKRIYIFFFSRGSDGTTKMARKTSQIHHG